jgi:hypothetical protein
MVRPIALLALALAASPALGQTTVTPPKGLEDMAPPPPGGVSVSQDGRIAISSDLCPGLTGAASGVPSADYTPGVDVNGNPVAPADLPSSAPPLKLDNFPIKISVNLQKRFGIPANSALFQGKAMIGLVTIRDGRAYFNGQPISQSEQDMMVAACKEAKR